MAHQGLDEKELVHTNVPSKDGLDEQKEKSDCSEAIEPIQELHNVFAKTPGQIRRGRIQIAVLFYSMLMQGWNDGSLGPMIPRIQEVYHVSYTAVASVFMLICAGQITGMAANVYLVPRLGFGKLLALGLSLQVVSHVLQAAASPFPLFVMSYYVYGLGATFYVSQVNGYVGSLEDGKETKLGWMHGFYGLGALLSPLVATQFAIQPRWSFHYLIALGLIFICVVMVVLVFRLQHQGDCLRDIGQEPEPSLGKGMDISVLWKVRALPILTGFLFFYVGTDVTLGGWIVSYIRDVRGGGPSSGYITSGFFGGLTLGRVVLIPVTSRLGEEPAVVIYSVLALGLEFVVWFVPSLIGNAVAVSLVGFFLGPLYPIAVSYASKLIPQYMFSACIGIICGLGQTGMAILPFMTGAMANKLGISSMQPLVVGMIVVMLALWMLTVMQKRRAQKGVASS